MRVFSFPVRQTHRQTHLRVRRERRRIPPLGWALWVVCAVGLGSSAPVAAQWPAELRVQVRDARSGDPLAGVTVLATGTARSGRTSPSGDLLLKGLPEGPVAIQLRALGYSSVERWVTLANGRRSVVRVALEPDPIPLSGISAEGARGAGGGFSRITGQAARGAGAATVGEAIATFPGVVVRRDDLGGAERISIRGSPSDGVLVLLDGAPLNDPLTGEADLSRVPLASVRDIILHRGAASARFGSRARAGAIEIRSAGHSETRFEVGGGSLGERIFRVGLTGPEAVGLSAGGELSRAHGQFGFDGPSELGGGRFQRKNADHERYAGWIAAETVGDRADLRLRLSGDRVERGLPGVGYGPTVHARQEDWGGGLTAAITSTSDRASWNGTVFASLRESRFRDPEPPAGLPYDETARVADVGARVGGMWELGAWGTVDGGLRVEALHVRASSLARSAPRSTTHLGAHVGVVRELLRNGLTVRARLALDRDGWTGARFLSHEATVSFPVGPLGLDLVHRSSFSPPTLSDQFFSEGVAIRPNPDLRGERIAGDLELNATLSWERLATGASLYHGDVEDLIVWQPDFRFVWSPSNTDVRRSGGEAWLELRGRSHPWTVRGSYTHNRLLYDRPGPDSVQLAYRPRHSGSLGGGWTGTEWGVAIDGRFVGTRFPVPAPVNALSAFWSWDATLRRSVRVSRWTIDGTARLHRIFDERATLIFGFPHPGRTLSLELSVRPGASPSSSR